MEKIFTAQSTVGEIVALFPKASDLFKTYKIDFCCGGNRPLCDVLTEKQLEVDVILQQLQSMYEKSLEKVEKNWLDVPHTELIEHIIQTHHQFLLEELPKLTPYVTKVARVHGPTQPHLIQVHQLFHELKIELEQHLMKEEKDVFPLIIQFEKHPTEENRQMMIRAIEELMAEHEHAGDIIKNIREITNDFTPPVDACGTYRLVYNRLEALEDDLFTHIHLENNILFPRILTE
ncbi:iron-sulfur cluster repair di-iron protein [Anoxybacillus flavithermus]|uniref:Regulator of cell morphogenesis and NO signaling, scdA family (2 C-terminal HHE domains) n=1 Tax=Anoxybacillus flavithermus AK1 TaxID=1297581 RepID=M8D4J0_9BACL|nr:iron-sulfur cluster repair di-iron protein [Anoxybacillus flavithermus]EMT45762.1 Regulator of cell morphogenesis and NO signaling, scdA family (2 C-terminal HHE domains) [Anoxybacillus flavithermus AK1]